MGFFDEAEVDVNDIPDDPFGFGNDYWPIRITEIKDPEVTKNGDKYGMMVQWIVDHPKYANHYVGKTGLGKGNWVQLPVPKPLQGQIPWNPKEDQKQFEALVNLRKLFEALGFAADEMSKVGPAEMMHRGCLAKIRVSQNDMGFWQFNLNPNNMKPLSSGNGMNEFTQSDSPEDPQDIVKRELEDI